MPVCSTSRHSGQETYLKKKGYILLHKIMLSRSNQNHWLESTFHQKIGQLFQISLFPIFLNSQWTYFWSQSYKNLIWFWSSFLHESKDKEREGDKGKKFFFSFWVHISMMMVNNAKTNKKSHVGSKDILWMLMGV